MERVPSGRVVAVGSIGHRRNLHAPRGNGLRPRRRPASSSRSGAESHARLTTRNFRSTRRLDGVFARDRSRNDLFGCGDRARRSDRDLPARRAGRPRCRRSSSCARTARRSSVTPPSRGRSASRPGPRATSSAVSATRPRSSWAGRRTAPKRCSPICSRRSSHVSPSDSGGPPDTIALTHPANYGAQARSSSSSRLSARLASRTSPS